MAATTVHLSLSFDSRRHHHRRELSFNSHFPPLFFTAKPTLLKSFTLSSSNLQTPSISSPLSTNQDNFQTLDSFSYSKFLDGGSLWIHLMRADEIETTVELLSESFAESMRMPPHYVTLLKFYVKKYLTDRREVLPHAATLVGFYRRSDDECARLAGTVEVSFDRRGANDSPPSPFAPRNSPYICNMTVTRPLRRRGIGWHLLRAGEELISRMTTSKEIYLHCRMIDEPALNMYTKAGYNIVRTDSLLILLKLQRRKHLMCKKLATSENPSKMDL